jgi:hypothetical protein
MHIHTLLATAALLLATAPVVAQDSMRLDLNSAPAAAAPVEGTATAQAPATQGGAAAGTAEDKDHIIACSIIYQRIADLYRDPQRNEPDKADSFLSTAYAYSQTADILYAKELGEEAAYDAIAQRMEVVSQALNQEAKGYNNGDVGVVNAWLGWCDEQGPFVQQTIDAYNAALNAQP